jgi:hypothetical protein
VIANFVYNSQNESFKPHKLTLSMEISSKPNVVKKAYNLKEISKYLDFISIISWKLTPNNDNSTELGNPLKDFSNDTSCTSIVRIFDLRSYI